MKKRFLLLPLLCIVLSLVTPVSAGDYLFVKNVNADDFTNALVDYCNHNEVHNMTEPEFKLSGHDFRSFNVTRGEYEGIISTITTLDFDYECKGTYVVFFPLPPFILPNEHYTFSGHMHVDYPDKELGNLYGLAVYDDDRIFTAWGWNWALTGNITGYTRFYANADETNRLTFQRYPPRL